MQQKDWLSAEEVAKEKAKSIDINKEIKRLKYTKLISLFLL
ncbi:hypothetical protein [Bacillus nitratireducens]